MTDIAEKLAAIGHDALEKYESVMLAYASTPNTELLDELGKHRKVLSEVAFAWNMAKRGGKHERFKALADWSGGGGGFSGGGASGGW